MDRRAHKTHSGFVHSRGLWLGASVSILVAVLAAGPAQSEEAAEDLSPDLPVRVEIEKPEVNLERGAELFARRCATCHGPTGTGNGATSRHLDPPPWNLTKGVFKVRSTPEGTMPTDEDLFRTLTFGIRGTAMPGWMGVPVDDRWQLVYFVKSLAPKGAKEATPLAIPEPPPATVQMIERGRAIYKTLQCIQCHGAEGRGDGPSSGALKDDFGHAIYPFDFSRSTKFKGGSTPRDIYRTIHTGLGGTPMKSYEGMITERDSWALVHFIRSLRVDAPKPVVMAETEAGTYAARVGAVQAALAVVQEEVLAARNEAAQARDDAAAAKAMLRQMLAQREAVEREAAERAAREQAVKDKAARDKATAASKAKERAQKRRALAKEARTFYRGRCAACHGRGGKGDGPAAAGLNPKPRDLSDPVWQKSISNRNIEKVILKGGTAIGKSAVMSANPDLAKRPDLVVQLRRIVRGFGRK